MTVGARLHTTYWGLLKQPDNQKLPSTTVIEQAIETACLGRCGEVDPVAIHLWPVQVPAQPTAGVLSLRQPEGFMTGCDQLLRPASFMIAIFSGIWYCYWHGTQDR